MSSQNALRVAVLLVGLVAYAPAVKTGFLYDDHILIESNPALRSRSLALLRHDFSSGVFGPPTGGINFYRPLQTLTTRAEYSLWKLNPVPYHVTNLLLHLGNAWLLFELLLALGFEELTATLAACLFAVHPIIVEDLLMVSGRGELLGFFFTLGCLVLFLRQTWGSVVLSLASYVLALFSKESAVITPALLMLVLSYKNAAVSRYAFVLPMALVTGAYLILRTHALGAVGPALGSATSLGHFFLKGFPGVLLRYGRIVLLPYDLHTDRLLPPSGPLWPAAAIAVTALAVWVFVKGPRWARFCFLWYLLNLLPKVPLMISGSFLSDHWAYPALPALALPIARGLAGLATRTRTAARYAGRAMSVLLLLAGVGGVYFNIATRNTDEKLYRSALRYTSSPVMKYNLGVVLLRQGRLAEAIPYFESVHASDPADANAARALSIARERAQRKDSPR